MDAVICPTLKTGVGLAKLVPSNEVLPCQACHGVVGWSYEL
jgi:hypothetical protein